MATIAASIVLVTSALPEIAKFGTGFVVAHQDAGQGGEEAAGLVVTCAHVISDVGGPDHVRVGGQTASVIACSSDGWPDLAVLRCPAAHAQPALPIQPEAQEGDAFELAGFHSYGGQRMIRQPKGRLGEQVSIESPATGERFHAWELILSAGTLQPGYSGSPVAAEEHGGVWAVVTHREGEGRRGLALRIEALSRIWPDGMARMAPATPVSPPRRVGGVTVAALRERTALFVGREDELRVLSTKLTTALKGEGTAGFVVGEAGMGKSTLAMKLITEVVEHYPGALVALARMDIVSGTNTSYGPFKSVMEQILLADSQMVDGKGRAIRTVDIVASSLRSMGVHHLGPFTSFAGAATDTLQQRLAMNLQAGADEFMTVNGLDMLYDCYAKAICNVAASRPLVIILDDVHWADDSSLLLLQHLGRLIEFSPILLIATLRPEEAARNPLIREVQDRLGEIGAFFIDLQARELQERDPRGRKYCQSYVAARYGSAASDRFIDFLADLTRGNPLFLSETLANIEEEGYLRRQPGGEWILAQPVEALRMLPTRIEHVISQRVNRLDETLLGILKSASVEGEVFTAEVVAKLRHIEDREFLGMVVEKLMRIHRLVVAGAIQRLGNGTSLHTFGFGHVLTKRYIYEYLLNEIERAILHEELAGCLEELWGETAAEIAPLLATHYSLAGNPEKTVAYALIAGEGFLGQFGWSEAARFGALGTRMLASNPGAAVRLPADVEVRLRLLWAHGELEGGAASELIDHIQVGIDALRPCLGRLADIPRRLAGEVQLTLGRLTSTKAVVANYQGNTHLDAAIRIAEELNDTQLLLAALSIYSLDSNLASQSEAEHQLATRLRCKHLAEQLGDPLLLAKALCDLSMHYIVFDSREPEPLARAEEYAAQAKGIARSANIVAEFNADLMLSWVYHHQGRYGPYLLEHRERLLRAAREHGQTTGEADALTDIGHYHAFIVGDEDLALTLMTKALDFRGRMGRHAVHDQENLSFLFFRLGRFDECRDLLTVTLRHVDEIRAARARAQIARTFALTGSVAQARAVLDAISRAGGPADTYVNVPLMMACADVGDVASALHLAGPVAAEVPMAGRRGVFWTYWDYPTALADVYRVAGDIPAAWTWIETATRYWQGLSRTTDVGQLVMFWEYEFSRAQVLASIGRKGEAAGVIARVAKAFEQCRHRDLAKAQRLATDLAGTAGRTDE